MEDQVNSIHHEHSPGNVSQTSSKSSTETDVNPLADLLRFDYSFGYDCKQHFNLCVLNDTTLLFYSGTIIHIFNTNTKSLQFKRSYSNSGVGHIAKNPKEDHIAVGEKCINPLIVVYSWPNFDVVSILRGGTTTGYSHLSYCPDGSMLVSQGREPDFLITIWDWFKQNIILRVKSHGQDVYNVEFSQFVPGQLTSCGLGHIKFWKMAKSFTGLKLQGELGRFGKTEICDLLAICAMPDEKVISGSQWGNLLVWEDRLIKLEVRQKTKENCHSAGISQVLYDPHSQDITSVGMDGWIKQWTKSTIDLANPPDEIGWYLEMQPAIEVLFKDSFGIAKLMSVYKKNSDQDDQDWFAQDGNGGIWKFSMSQNGPPPRRLLKTLGSEVADMASSTLGHYLATLGNNGCLQIHDVSNRDLLISKQCKASGHSLVWLPIHIEATGAVLLGGFGDGMIRMFVVSLRDLQRFMRRSSEQSLLGNLSPNTEYINIIQRIKGHSGPITCLKHNPRGSIIVSGGQDKTVFIYQIMPKREYITLMPIGYVELSAPISYITWRPKQNASVIVACADSTLVEMQLPEKPKSVTDNPTYSLKLDMQKLKFKSMKSELLRAQEIQEIENKKQAKLEKKQVELNKIKADNPNLDIDEDLFLMDSDEEIEFPPLEIPEYPSPILFVIVLPSGNLYLSMGGFDCGFLYEYSFDVSGPISCHEVPAALNIPIKSYLLLCEGQLMVLGLTNGVLRLVHCQNGKPDFNQYHDLAMHDTTNGEVRHICSSCDGLYVYSCGSDGCIFSYQMFCENLVNPSKSIESVSPRRLTKRISMFISGSIPNEIVDDIDGSEEPSLEDVRRNEERLQHLKLADERKESIRRQLINLRLRFDYIMNRNIMLPESQILPQSSFELDPRITEALEKNINEDYALMMRKIIFKLAKSRVLVEKMQKYFVGPIASLDVTVRAIKKEDLRIKAFTHNKLTPEFLEAEQRLKTMLESRSQISEITVDKGSRGTGSIITMSRQSGLDSIIRLQPYYSKMTLKTKKALIRQNVLKMKKERRAQQWQLFLDTKPDINADDPADIKAYEQAIKTIGDFKLKSAADYRVPEEIRVSPSQKYGQIVQLHREIYNMKETFNHKVCHIRDSKISLVRRFKQLYADLDVIQKELPVELRKERLPIPTCWLRNNFPEHIFRLEFGADPQFYNPISSPYDEEYYVLRVNDRTPVLNDIFCLPPPVDYTLQQLMELSADDDVDTPWEHELKVLRMIRLLLKQDMIINEMVRRVDSFDKILESLSIDRLSYARDIKVMEIFKLTLVQELLVINSYADREDAINHKINVSVQIRNEKVRQKSIILESIETKQQDIALWQFKLTELQEEMAEKLLNNKFATFLNKVFKKKKVFRRTDESFSESSSSEDDSDDDIDDVDNDDYVPLKFDENVCPDGCDPRLFQDTLNSRKLRYEIEDSIAELRRQIEENERELQLCSKDLIKSDNDVKTNTEDQEILQFEKQQKLNNVEVVVVLNLSQCCHFVSASHPEDGLVQNPLVFHSGALYNLASRISELQSETEQEEIKIRKQVSLRQRLDKHRKYVIERKKSLKSKIDEEIIKKFGVHINVDLMEEHVIKKMVNQVKKDFELEKIRKKYDIIIAGLKNDLWHRTEALIKIERENTRRLKLQTMLEQENMKLQDLLKLQVSHRGRLITITERKANGDDVQLLENILAEQIEHGKHFRNEINMLKYKSTPPSNTSGQHPLLGRRDVVQPPAEYTEVEETLTVDNKISEKTMGTIDSALEKLASGSTTQEAAQYLVDNMMPETGSKEVRTSALECAIRLVEELLEITTQDRGDVTLVEKYANQLSKYSDSQFFVEGGSKEE